MPNGVNPNIEASRDASRADRGPRSVGSRAPARYRTDVRSRSGPGGPMSAVDRAAEDDSIAVADALSALAFMGDLSMGQPTDHSPRVAWLAVRLARCSAASAAQLEHTAQVALLRWSGCTANAPEVAVAGDLEVWARRSEEHTSELQSPT